MSEQRSVTPAKKRSLKWLAFVVPIFTIWLGLEVYDYVPNRPWIYRQVRTFAFVDVTVKLIVDNQPLTFTRTIRCIRQPKPLSLEPGTREEPSVFDALGGVSRSGRTIVVNVVKACSQLQRKDLGQNADHFEPVSLSAGEVDMPSLYESVGSGYLPDHIVSYSSDALLRGDYGIKLEDVSISHSAKTFMLFDGGQYDWLGGGGWYGSGRHKIFKGYFAYQMPEDLWGAYEPLKQAIASCARPCIINLVVPLGALKMFPKPPEFGNPLQRDEPIYPVDFDLQDSIFRLHSDSVNRIVLRDLPRDQGIREGEKLYLRYEVNGEALSLPYERSTEHMHYAHPYSDVIFVTSNEQIFFISKSSIGVNVRR